MKKHLLTLQSRVQTSGILFAIIASAALVLTASADPTNCTAPPAGLVNWWRGEGNALDQAGTNNGTAVNGVVFPTGKVGQAFGFNGTSSYVQVPSSANLNPSGSFSIETWIYPQQDTPEGAVLVTKWGDTGELENQRSYTVSLLPGGVLSFGISDAAHQWDSSFHAFTTDAGAVTVQAWNHVVAVYDQSSGTRRIFANGVQVKSRTDAPITIYNGAAPLTFGADSRGGGQVVGFFGGLLDEVSLYNRALSAPEVQALYLAGNSGKCVVDTPPTIISQPANQAVFAGDNAVFEVLVTGTQPMSYQWSVNGTNIAGATATSLLLPNVQLADAGVYAVVVTNPVGTATSSNAVLTVNPPRACAPLPAGLVSWWRGGGNAFDQVGTNNGTPVGNTTYGTGRVGQAFVMGGANGDGVTLGNPAGLQLQDLTIELWIKRASASQITTGPVDGGNFLAYGSGGYCFGMYANGSLVFGRAYVDGVTSVAGLVTDTNWHHVAVAKAGSTVVYYVDGVAYPVAAYTSSFTFTTTAAIGMLGDSSYGFWGSIDELAVYRRALASAEIQGLYHAGSAGKCVVDTPPTITFQPANQTAFAGDYVTFDVLAAGTQPFSYQWNLNGSSLPGATNSALALTDVQPGQAGTYTVLVTNLAGSILSSNAVLTVNPPPPCAPPPAGLVSWWRGGGNALDQVGTNNGTAAGNTTYGAGRVGQALVFGGANGDGVTLGNPADLQLQDVTIEAWIKRASASQATTGPADGGVILGYGSGGYAMAVFANGSVDFGKSYVSDVRTAAGLVADTNWHHVAVAKSGSTVVFYVDGVAYPAAAYTASFTFTSTVAIGMMGNSLYGFWGSIDELAIYGRALAAAEVQAIYNAGSGGKCRTSTAPVITSQPMDRTVTEGGTAVFTVGVGGTAPLSYQWQLNGTNLAGATGISLTLSSVQSAQAGNYAVWVTNAFGSSLSSNALLTVNPPPPCVPPPAGLVGWWRGESNAWDQVGFNSGTLRNGAGFGAGAVGRAFNFNGTSQYVDVTNSASLNPTGSISVEAWIYPRLPLNSSIAPIIKKVGEGAATQDGYTLEVSSASALRFGVYLSGVRLWRYAPSAPLYPNQWSHVVGVFNGTNAAIYLNGALVGTPTAASGQIVPSGNNLQIGHDPSMSTRYFNGLIDEASVYSTALSAAQIQAIYLAGMSGKCPVATPPSILVPPTNQAVTVGSNVTFSVTAAGTPPLSYQWSFGSAVLDGATNAVLTLTNAQFSQAGNYSVVITNAGGAVFSSNATLSVNFPPAVVRVVSVTSAPAGATVIVPVALAANGNENGLSFSLNFDPAKLTYVSMALGSGASGANLLTNAAQAASGKLGMIVALPPNKTFPAGTQEVVQVSFTTALLTDAVSTSLSFGDDPIARQLSDAPGNVLAASYAGGTVSILVAEFEGDVSPRPNGDKAILLTDWVMAGRYAARLDYPANGAEFQRADCAPRSTLGDGAITVSDWVQVGRYAAGWDPLTAAGGPTNEVTSGGNAIAKGLSFRTPKGDPPGSRLLEVSDTMLIQGLTGSVSVQLESLGDENAVGFSLSFDPVAVNFVGASLGSGGNAATLIVNAGQAGSGRLGFALALGTGNSFAAGTRELVKVTFRASAADQGKYSVMLTNQPVPCEVSDPAALRLAAGYVSGTITVNPLPSLSIGRSGESITLAWPLWATNFGLQAAEGGLPPAVPWTNLATVPVLTSNGTIVILPITATNRVYRLFQP